MHPKHWSPTESRSPWAVLLAWSPFQDWSSVCWRLAPLELSSCCFCVLKPSDLNTKSHCPCFQGWFAMQIAGLVAGGTITMVTKWRQVACPPQESALQRCIRTRCHSQPVKGHWRSRQKDNRAIVSLPTLFLTALDLWLITPVICIFCYYCFLLVERKGEGMNQRGFSFWTWRWLLASRSFWAFIKIISEIGTDSNRGHFGHQDFFSS